MTSIFSLPKRLVEPLRSPSLPGYNPREHIEERAEINRIQNMKYRKHRSGRKSTLDKRLNILLQYIASNATESKPLSSLDIGGALKKDRTMINNDLKVLRDAGAVKFRKDVYSFVYWIA